MDWLLFLLIHERMVNLVNGNIWQVKMALIRFSGEMCRNKQIISTYRHWVVNQRLVGMLYDLLFILKILGLPGLEKCFYRTLS